MEKKFFFVCSFHQLWSIEKVENERIEKNCKKLQKNCKKLQKNCKKLQKNCKKLQKNCKKLQKKIFIVVKSIASLCVIIKLFLAMKHPSLF